MSEFLWGKIYKFITMKMLGKPMNTFHRLLIGFSWVSLYGFFMGLKPMKTHSFMGHDCISWVLHGNYLPMKNPYCNFHWFTRGNFIINMGDL